ncbi:hypothetical protein T02_8075 [Trichinella nativa]|uniref:Uncharacterized protein n=1 Tax=Trichinella nativa TaxID=6335 RepID=A0A0V1L8K6_9BILA|nr:hypothetical protein T02_8075 [Trichinella nativa]
MHVRLGLLFTIVGLIQAFDPLFKDANVQIESTDAHHHLVVRNAELQEQTPCVPDLNGDTSHCAQKQASKTAVTEAKPRSRRCARCRSECGCGAAPMPIPAAPPPMVHQYGATPMQPAVSTGCGCARRPRCGCRQRRCGCRQRRCGCRQRRCGCRQRRCCCRQRCACRPRRCGCRQRRCGCRQRTCGCAPVAEPLPPPPPPMVRPAPLPYRLARKA